MPASPPLPVGVRPAADTGSAAGRLCEYDVRFSLVPNMSGWRGSINGEQLGSRGSRGSNSGVSSRWETSLAATESSRARRRKVAVERTASAVATRPPPPALCGECGLSGSSPLGVGPRRAVSPAPRGRARTRPGSGVRGAPTPASACTARSRSLCRRGRGLPYDTHTTHIQSRRSGLGKRTAEPSRQPSVAHETGSDFGERTGEPQQRAERTCGRGSEGPSRPLAGPRGRERARGAFGLREALLYLRLTYVTSYGYVRRYVLQVGTSEVRGYGLRVFSVYGTAVRLRFTALRSVPGGLSAGLPGVSVGRLTLQHTGIQL